MSNTIAPTDWPNNMSADDRKVWLHEQISAWVGEKSIEVALSTAELGNLSHTQKAVAYRSILIVGSIRHCRHNKRAEVRMTILILITYLSDNAKGYCFLTIVKMMELLKRTRQCIVDNIEALEEDGLIGVARVDGMPNIYWPRIPAALAEMTPNPVWFIEAVTVPVKAKVYGNVEEVIAAATGDRSTPVDRSTALDRNRSISTKEPVYSNQGTGPFEPDSISSLNLFSSSRGGAATSAKPNGKAAMAAAMGGEAAFAERNITVTESGRLVIGDELRRELLDAYTDEQIDGAADCTPAACGRPDPTKLDLLKQLRRQCVYRKTDARKTPGVGATNNQSAKRTYAR